MQLPDFLESNADGEICVLGHRIRLIDIVARYEEGHSPEAIVLDHYPTLELATVHKAIGFYLDHQDELKQLIERHRAEMVRLEGQSRRGPGMSELRGRMQAMRRAKAP